MGISKMKSILYSDSQKYFWNKGFDKTDFISLIYLYCGEKYSMDKIGLKKFFRGLTQQIWEEKNESRRY